MKIQIASDLHLEMRRGRQPAPGEFRAVAERDLLVLAGDIGTHTNAWPFMERELEHSPVIYVPGNHEYYSMTETREQTDAEWKRLAQSNPGLHYLLGESVTIGGVRFWGGPWYSDLFGERDWTFIRKVRRRVEDFQAHYNNRGQWSVQEHLNEHSRQSWLLRRQAGRVDVVVTHWPPTKHAIAPRFKGERLNGYFVNDREDLVREIGAQLWINGRVHEPHDVVIGDTRVIGNPTGYPRDFGANRSTNPIWLSKCNPLQRANAERLLPGYCGAYAEFR